MKALRVIQVTDEQGSQALCGQADTTGPHQGMDVLLKSSVSGRAGPWTPGAVVR